MIAVPTRCRFSRPTQHQGNSRSSGHSDRRRPVSPRHTPILAIAHGIRRRGTANSQQNGDAAVERVIVESLEAAAAEDTADELNDEPESVAVQDAGGDTQPGPAPENPQGISAADTA